MQGEWWGRIRGAGSERDWVNRLRCISGRLWRGWLGNVSSCMNPLPKHEAYDAVKYTGADNP